MSNYIMNKLVEGMICESHYNTSLCLSSLLTDSVLSLIHNTLYSVDRVHSKPFETIR